MDFNKVQTHVLLQKQMQEIIESQFKEIEHLKAQVYFIFFFNI